MTSIYDEWSQAKADQSDKYFIEWKSIVIFRALLKYFQARHASMAKYSRHVSNRPKYPNRPSELNPSGFFVRTVIVWSCTIDKELREQSKSKIGTLHFETWLFDERIRRADELGVALDRSDKWFDRFAHFFVYSTMIYLVLNLLWPVVR